MPTIDQQVRAAVGAAYDPKARYVVVRPGMQHDPKFAECTKVGEFVEDTRNETSLLVLRKPDIVVAKSVAVVAKAAEKVRSMLGRSTAPAMPPKLTK